MHYFTFTNKWVGKELKIKTTLIIIQKKESQYGMINTIITAVRLILKVTTIKRSSQS